MLLFTQINRKLRITTLLYHYSHQCLQTFRQRQLHCGKLINRIRRGLVALRSESGLLILRGVVVLLGPGGASLISGMIFIENYVSK